MITAYCMLGGHSGPVCGTEQDGATVPEGWELVRASFDRSTGEWYANPDSPAKILCCPEHQLGAWMCGVGHMFYYAAPPAEPPWCAHPGCQALGFRWIIKDEVTSRDWIPEGQSWT